MYLIINGDKETAYTITRRIVSADTVRFFGVTPEPGTVAGTIAMYTDSGYPLSEDTVADYARQEYSGDTLTLTNAPEPDPPGPQPTPTSEYVTYDELAQAIREGVNAV